jgi:endoglucanase
VTTSIPRWRGFNIVDLFSTSVRWKEHFPMNDGVVAEQDFAIVRELGFNFVRIPMSYLFFGKGPFGRTPDPERMHLMDRAVEFGQKHDVHVVLAFHRGPGYCINSQSPFDFPEHGDLFTNERDLTDFVTWWSTIADRYGEVSPEALSFNLLNEPVNIDDNVFERTFLPATRAIHAISPDRLIHVEGGFRQRGETITLEPPTTTVVEMPNVISSVHFYHPLPLTHFGCPWSQARHDLEPPTWPYQSKLVSGAETPLEGDDAILWDKDALRAVLRPYLDLAEAGHAVHVGEMGAFSTLPHDVYLAYLADVIDILDDHEIGYAMWNLRGPFGVLDTDRANVDHTDFHGHQLDRKLVDLLRGN